MTLTDRHAIGRAMELEAMKYLETQGYHTFWRPPRAKFTTQDIWSVFDFVCIKNRVVTGVQVCKDRKGWVEPRAAKLIVWALKAEFPHMIYFVLAYKRNKDGSVTWRFA